MKNYHFPQVEVRGLDIGRVGLRQPREGSEVVDEIVIEPGTWRGLRDRIDELIGGIEDAPTRAELSSVMVETSATLRALAENVCPRLAALERAFHDHVQTVPHPESGA